MTVCAGIRLKTMVAVLSMAGCLVQLAAANQPAAPSRDWIPRQQQFAALVESRPIPNDAKLRLVGMLDLENALVNALLDEGTATSVALSENYSEYVSGLTSVVFELVKEGYAPGLPVLIRAPYDAYSAIGRYLGADKWRESLPYYLSVGPSRGQGIRFADAMEMLGMICRLHCTDMSTTHRQQVESRLLQALADPNVGTRMAAIGAVADAGLKAAIPLLRERAKRAVPVPSAGGRRLEREAAIKAIRQLERLP